MNLKLDCCSSFNSDYELENRIADFYKLAPMFITTAGITSSVSVPNH